MGAGPSVTFRIEPGSFDKTRSSNAPLSGLVGPDTNWVKEFKRQKDEKIYSFELSPPVRSACQSMLGRLKSPTRVIGHEVLQNCSSSEQINCIRADKSGEEPVGEK